MSFLNINSLFPTPTAWDYYFSKQQEGFIIITLTDDIEGYVAIPEEWIEGECFLLRAYGDSMVDIGVGEGDLVLVKKATEAADGQVIVALTEDGNTLKRIFWENGKPRLHAENKAYPESRKDIYPKSLIIQGIALKVIKDIH